MNLKIYFTLLSLTFYTANAQVQISTIKRKRNYSFPFIHSKNAAIAKNINSYLQKHMLQNEKIGSCDLSLKDNNTLKVRGYIGISLLGRTETWTRTSM